MDKLIEEISNYQLMHKFNKLIIEMIDYCKSIDISQRDYNTFLNIGMSLIVTPLKLAKYRYSDNAVFLKYYEEMYSKYFQASKIPISIDIEKIEAICKNILQLFTPNIDKYLIEFQTEPNSPLTIRLRYYHIIDNKYLEFPFNKNKELKITTDIVLGENPILKDVENKQKQKDIVMKNKIHTLLAYAELIKMVKEELMEIAVEFNYSVHVDDLKTFIEKYEVQNKHYFTQMNEKINQLNHYSHFLN